MPHEPWITAEQLATGDNDLVPVLLDVRAGEKGVTEVYVLRSRKSIEDDGDHRISLFWWAAFTVLAAATWLALAYAGSIIYHAVTHQ